MIAFGPVPSRRLGNSLGINNIPPKKCTYACVYCQLGRTIGMRIKRNSYFPAEHIYGQVREKVQKAGEHGEKIDYLTFVPDGEPTLDIDLGREIELLKPLGTKIAVITNGSLIWRKDVRDELSKADWVSVKIDAVQEEIWRRIDRPHGSLRLQRVLDGIQTFSQSYAGKLTTETMLVRGINDRAAVQEAVADYISRIDPAVAYLAVPIRPPAEKTAIAPTETVINKVFQIFDKRVRTAEYLIGYEGNDFAFTGNAEDDILSITAVHPMREDAIHDFLDRAGSSWSVITHLIRQNLLIETTFEGKKFYLRRLHRNN